MIRNSERVCKMTATQRILYCKKKKPTKTCDSYGLLGGKCQYLVVRKK